MEPKIESVNTQELKSKYGFLPEERLILYAGQLESRKGIDKLIKAFLLIKDKFPTTKLIIAGSGDFNSYFPLAQGCIGRICFTGKLNKNTLSDFYRFSEMGIIPSYYEQCSYVLIEMIQYCLPLVISDVPGLNELILHKETGLVCKTHPHVTLQNALEVDEADLAIQMEYLLLNKTEGFNFAREAYIKMLVRNSMQNMGEETIKIYNMLLNEKFFNNKINKSISFSY
jgi:glycosyltransferase involved in cell wall biosynthesis